eukprot:1136280-Pelagomonas_calceolata.AAC.6
MWVSNHACHASLMAFKCGFAATHAMQGTEHMTRASHAHTWHSNAGLQPHMPCKAQCMMQAAAKSYSSHDTRAASNHGRRQEKLAVRSDLIFPGDPIKGGRDVLLCVAPLAEQPPPPLLAWVALYINGSISIRPRKAVSGDDSKLFHSPLQAPQLSSNYTSGPINNTQLEQTRHRLLKGEHKQVCVPVDTV